MFHCNSPECELFGIKFNYRANVGLIDCIYFNSFILSINVDDALKSIDIFN